MGYRLLSPYSDYLNTGIYLINLLDPNLIWINLNLIQTLIPDIHYLDTKKIFINGGSRLIQTLFGQHHQIPSLPAVQKFVVTKHKQQFSKATNWRNAMHYHQGYLLPNFLFLLQRFRPAQLCSGRTLWLCYLLWLFPKYSLSPNLTVKTANKSNF